MISGTLAEYLHKAEDFLRKKNISSPRLEAQVIFSHFLQMPRFALFTESEKPLQSAEITLLREKIALRAKGMPVAYITGIKEFMGHTFRIDNRALIPRPETEELTELALKFLSDKSENICDMCCGSGIIGITLALQKPNVQICLADISTSALSLAEENVHLVGVPDSQVHLRQSDLFAGFPNNADIVFTMIVSNPPYILYEEKNSLQKEVVDHEPHVALFVENPELFFRKMAEGSYQYLSAGGHFLIETSPLLISMQAGVLSESGFKDIAIQKDLSGKNRFLHAKKG